jgi:hypothetical protein
VRTSFDATFDGIHHDHRSFDDAHPEHLAYTISYKCGMAAFDNFRSSVSPSKETDTTSFYSGGFVMEHS